MRGFHLVAATVFLSSFGLCGTSGKTSAQPNIRPNILLMIADDMGLDASPCHLLGHASVSMPTLERLCREGMVFENAYAAPVCSPTRATIMTGQYGFRTGVGSAIPRMDGQGLSIDEKSLIDQLNGTRYSSAIIGKWHLAGSDAPLDHPFQFGVKEYYGMFKEGCLLYTSPSPRDLSTSRMPSSA